MSANAQARIIQMDGDRALTCFIEWREDLSEAGRADFIRTLGEQITKAMQARQ